MGRFGTSQLGPESNIPARFGFLLPPPPFDLSHAMPPPLLNWIPIYRTTLNLHPFPSHYYNMFHRLPCAATSLSLSSSFFWCPKMAGCNQGNRGSQGEEVRL
ncbi:hypothetical protein BHE74_00009798 [Ensete ventricosum]|nr:hypothetical protein GW17_00016226 [Ensete ventricosum]RWW81770.1 hypothetical protein BHE74_00009798 [Ensete ventricosum]RZS01778.1 hypothetical protein BHM03_00031699 [Ensete ventricosum]